MKAVTPFAEVEEGEDTPEDRLSRVVQWVEDAEDEGSEARKRSERDRDYYDGFQMTYEEAEELKRRNQPVIAFNLVQGKVDYLLGLEKQQRTDPKAFPRNPDDEESAEAATDAIRYVCDINDMPMLASGVWENMVIEGAGGVDVCAEQAPDGDMRIAIHRVHWDRMIWDPHSREKDFSDAKYLGTIIWMDEADLIQQWPDGKRAADMSYETVSRTDTFDDRPRGAVWVDRKRRRVRVCEMYWQEGGVWYRGVFTRGGWLEEGAPSPYVDEYGQPECPLVFASSYVDRENKRYGSVRALIDPQDEINLRHRKAVHLLSARQVILEEGAVRDENKARQELAKPDGLVSVAPGMRFDVVETQDLSAGQAQLLQEAKSVFQVMGPNAALLGKQGKEASGRAIALSQQGGQMEIGALLDIHRNWRRRVYAAIWNRIKQYWTAEKWVRVTDEERNVRFVGLNQQQPQMDPMTGEVVMATHNNVAEMVVDIVVEEGPDVATLRQEQFATLAEIAKAAPGVVPPDILIEASDLRNKDRLLKRLRGEEGPDGQPAPPPPPPPEVVIAQQKAQADAAKHQQEMALKAQSEAASIEIEREKIAAQIRMKEMDIQAQRENAALQMQAAQQSEAFKMSAETERHNASLSAQREAAMLSKPDPVDDTPMRDAAAQIGEAVNAIGQLVGVVQQVGQRLAGVEAQVSEIAEDISAPVQVARGPDGRVAQVRRGRRVMQVQRGPDGRAMGLS